ncbi:MAG: hypothetical protein C5B54_03640 [Acidobacteria bacterium]|nr:MAG: hypothetical protein C5B54_03640 [Acidobacteriota bacterium]
MTNIFETMTEAQARRWERQRASGRSRYVLKRTLVYGAIVPALIIWGILRWTSFGNLLILLAIFSLPVDYVIARLSWVFHEHRYKNYTASLHSHNA